MKVKITQDSQYKNAKGDLEAVGAGSVIELDDKQARNSFLGRRAFKVSEDSKLKKESITSSGVAQAKAEAEAKAAREKEIAKGK